VPILLRAITLLPGELDLGLGAAVFSPSRQSPAEPTPPVAPTPAGTAGFAGISASVLLLSGFAALLVMFSAAVPRLIRRLDAVSASWRPMPFLSLLERPG
jgi:hypothetical protein